MTAAAHLAAGLAGTAVVLGAVAGCGTAAAPPTPAATSVATVTVPAAAAAAPSSGTPDRSGGSGSNPGAGLTPPNCPTSQLTIRTADREGAAGSLIGNLVFTNSGSSTCQLRGYPGVSFVAGDDGHQVGPAAEEDGPRTDQVNLAPGESSHVQLRQTNAAAYPASTCAPTAVRGFRVYPPGDTAAAYVPAPGTACSGGVVTLHVRTMQPGAS